LLAHYARLTRQQCKASRASWPQAQPSFHGIISDGYADMENVFDGERRRVAPPRMKPVPPWSGDRGA
jgi:hypothetical protein